MLRRRPHSLNPKSELPYQSQIATGVIGLNAFPLVIILTSCLGFWSPSTVGIAALLVLPFGVLSLGVGTYFERRREYRDIHAGTTACVLLGYLNIGFGLISGGIALFALREKLHGLMWSP